AVLDEPAGRGVVAGEQRQDFPPHLVVGLGRLLDERAALGRRGCQRLFEQNADGFPALRVHVSARESSRWSHASASRCSRPIVPTETFSARAVSSTLRPPKNRSSITLLLRGSTSASAFSASSSATRSSPRLGANATTSSRGRGACPAPRFRLRWRR